MIIVLISVLVLVLALILYLSNFHIAVTNYKIESLKIPASFNGFKILQISDLHNKNFGNNNLNIINIVNNANPDIVVFTGDMISYKDSNFDAYLIIAKSIAKKYTSYYIFGNHEQFQKIINTNAFNAYCEKLRSFGIIILENEYIAINNNVDFLSLYGYMHDIFYYNHLSSFSLKHRQKHLSMLSKRNKTDRLNIDEMQNTLGNKILDNYTILLAHNPIFFDVYSKWGADLILSGHMHGGVFSLAFYRWIAFTRESFFFLNTLVAFIILMTKNL